MRLESGPIGPLAPKKAPINFENLSREEAFGVFQSMLSDLGVGVTWKWEDVNRVV